MRILLLGANGQLGFELWRLLNPLHDVIPSTRSGLLGGMPVARCNQAQPGDCARLVHALGPDLVLNAAAYTAVDLAEQEPELALRVNQHAVAELAVACRERAIKLIHYSTDYVYSGLGERPWREQDPAAPASQYGLSKHLGELAIAQSGCEHLILRTQWLYASRGKNFLRTMLRLGQAGNALRIVNDQVGAPTPAAWVAVATMSLLLKASGLMNIAAAGQCTWFEFAEAIFAARGLQVVVLPCNTAEYASPAPRPAFGVLDLSRALQFGIQLPHWRDGMRQVLAELAETPP